MDGIHRWNAMDRILEWSTTMEHMDGIQGVYGWRVWMECMSRLGAGVTVHIDELIGGIVRKIDG